MWYLQLKNIVIKVRRQPCVIVTDGRLYYNFWLAVFTWGGKYTLKNPPFYPPTPSPFSLTPPLFNKAQITKQCYAWVFGSKYCGRNAHFRLYRYFLLWNSVVCLEPKGLQLVIACRPPVTGYSHVINRHHCIILCTLSKCPHAIKSKLRKQYFAHVEYSYLHLICTKP